MRKMRMTKRCMAYMAAAVIMAGAGFMGSSFNSNAETQYIATDSVNVRNEANGDTIVDGLALGAEVDVTESATGSDGNTWNKVTYTLNGTTRQGWVRSDLMSATQPQADPEPATTLEPEQPADTQEPADVQEPVDEEPEVDFTMPDTSVSGDGYQADGDLSFSVMGESMTISSEFADAQIPAHFSKTDITYNNTSVKGLTCEYADVLLVYLKDAAGEGEFFVFVPEQQMVYSFITLSSGDNQLIVLLPPADALVADSYGKTIYAMDEDTAVTAYQYNQTLDTVSASTVTAEYFYVYGVTQNGIPGWYLYDDVEKTYIRATTDLSVDLDSLSTSQQAPTETADDSLEKMIIVVMGAICFICIILAIAFGIRSMRARKGLLEYEEEEEEEEEELSFRERRKLERKYRHFMENFDEEGDDYPEEKEPEAIPELDRIVAQIEDEGWKEKEDYDFQISDKEDYDLTDENTEADLKEFDEIEDILLAGLEESITELEREAGAAKDEEPDEDSEFVKIAKAEMSEELVKQEEPTQKTKSKKNAKKGNIVKQSGEDDEWKDLEFLDL